MPMQAGRLDRRITFQEPLKQQNEYGEEITTWSDFSTVWAEKKDLSGRELYAAQQVNTEITTKFIIRRLDGITTHFRIKYTDHEDRVQYWDISHIAEIGRHEGFEIMAIIREYDAT